METVKQAQKENAELKVMVQAIENKMKAFLQHFSQKHLDTLLRDNYHAFWEKRRDVLESLSKKKSRELLETDRERLLLKWA